MQMVSKVASSNPKELVLACLCECEVRTSGELPADPTEPGAPLDGDAGQRLANAAAGDGREQRRLPPPPPHHHLVMMRPLAAFRRAAADDHARWCRRRRRARVAALDLALHQHHAAALHQFFPAATASNAQCSTERTNERAENVLLRCDARGETPEPAGAARLYIGSRRSLGRWQGLSLSAGERARADKALMVPTPPRATPRLSPLCRFVLARVWKHRVEPLRSFVSRCMRD